MTTVFGFGFFLFSFSFGLIGFGLCDVVLMAILRLSTSENNLCVRVYVLRARGTY